MDIRGFCSKISVRCEFVRHFLQTRSAGSGILCTSGIGAPERGFAKGKTCLKQIFKWINKIPAKKEVLSATPCFMKI